MKSALGFILTLLAVLAVKTVAAAVQFSYTEEWQMWKTQHGKSYGSVREELERHLVWLANREYINAHNQNSHIFEFTLAMNHLGDMVSFSIGVTYLILRLYASSLTCCFQPD